MTSSGVRYQTGRTSLKNLTKKECLNNDTSKYNSMIL